MALRTVVHPGDIVVGDADGVAVVREADSLEVLSRVRELLETERKRIDEIQGGTPFKPAIDEALREKGVIE